MQNKNLGFKFCLVLGVVGFLAGYIGPLILRPDANQGPLLGIFITGPLGFFAGFCLWFLSRVFSWSLVTQRKWLGVGCGVLVMTVVAVALAPKPDWVGWIYEVEVMHCRAVHTETENVLVDWRRRIADADGLPARPGWPEEVKRVLKEDTGSLVDVKILGEKSVKKERSFFNKESWVAYAIMDKVVRTKTFYIAQPCASLPSGTTGTYFVSSKFNVKADKDRPWPPVGVGDLLFKASLLPVPHYMKSI